MYNYLILWWACLPNTKFVVGWGDKKCIPLGFNKSRTKWSCAWTIVSNHIQSKSYFLMYHVKPQRHICYHVLSLGNGHTWVLRWYSSSKGFNGR